MALRTTHVIPNGFSHEESAVPIRDADSTTVGNDSLRDSFCFARAAFKLNA